MALVLRFSFAPQVIAAFVIFVLGYIGLFATLMLAVLLVRFLYEAAKWLIARASAQLPIAIPFPSSSGDQRERRIPLSTTQLTDHTPRAKIAFHPAFNRRRVSENVR